MDPSQEEVEDEAEADTPLAATAPRGSTRELCLILRDRTSADKLRPRFQHKEFSWVDAKPKSFVEWNYRSSPFGPHAPPGKPSPARKRPSSCLTYCKTPTTATGSPSRPNSCITQCQTPSSSSGARALRSTPQPIRGNSAGSAASTQLLAPQQETQEPVSTGIAVPSPRERHKRTTALHIFEGFKQQQVETAYAVLKKSFRRPRSAPAFAARDACEESLRQLSGSATRSTSAPPARTTDTGHLGLGISQRASATATIREYHRTSELRPMTCKGDAAVERLGLLADLCGDHARGSVTATMQHVLQSRQKELLEAREKARPKKQPQKQTKVCRPRAATSPTRKSALAGMGSPRDRSCTGPAKVELDTVSPEEISQELASIEPLPTEEFGEFGDGDIRDGRFPSPNKAKPMLLYTKPLKAAQETAAQVKNQQLHSLFSSAKPETHHSSANNTKSITRRGTGAHLMQFYRKIHHVEEMVHIDYTSTVTEAEELEVAVGKAESIRVSVGTTPPAPSPRQSANVGGGMAGSRRYSASPTQPLQDRPTTTPKSSVTTQPSPKSGSGGSPSKPRMGGFGSKVQKLRNSKKMRESMAVGSSDIRSRLSQVYGSAIADVKKVGSLTQDSMAQWNVIQLARTMNMSVSDVREVKTVFDSLDANDSGTLDFSEFEEAVSKLIQEQNKEAPLVRVKAMCKSQWRSGDRDGSGSIDFFEFLKWWAMNRFKEDLLLSDEERKVRELARKYKVSEAAVDEVKKCFDYYDSDKSGHIDIQEFAGILYRIMKVPADVQLPELRIQYLWREIDQDGSGSAGFDEFLPWWINRRDTLMPYDNYYQQIRSLRQQRRDPPAYIAGRLSRPRDSPRAALEAKMSQYLGQ